MRKIVGIVTAIALIGTSMLPAAAAVDSTATPVNSTTAETGTVKSQAYTYKSVTVGGAGYCDNIIFNPTEKNLIYARTDMGGAYRWDEENQKWIPLLDWVDRDHENYHGCDSLATDPVDTNRVYIQAGKYTLPGTPNGVILRSEDKGNTWDVVQLPFKVGGNMQGRYFGERLCVDPNSNNVIYMGTRCGNGLWKSTDYGKTWAKVESFTEVGDYTPLIDDPTSYDTDITGVVWVTPDKTSSSKGEPCKTLYVGVCNKKGENTIFVTKDGGKTWNPLEGQPTYTVKGKNDDGSTVEKAILPTHGVLASNGVLYITYNDTVNVYRGDKGDVWKYNTKTGVWTQISPAKSSDDANCWFGYGGISVDANDPNTLVVSSDEEWWPDANIWRSTDGGATWTAFWDWNGYPSRTLRYNQDISYSPWLEDDSKIEPEAKIKIGWMIGNVSIDPFNSDRMMWGTGATVYCTKNLTELNKGGKVDFACCTKGLEQYVAPSLISPTTGTAHLISGVYDVGGFVHNDLDKSPSKSFQSPYFSGTTCIDYAELNPSKFVRVGNTSKATDPHIGISWDTGKDWYQVSNCYTPADGQTNYNGGTVAMSADGNSIVWSPEGNIPVCYSTDTGSSWKKSSGVPTNVVIASDRVNPKKFYAHSSDGAIYVSTDGGATFKKTVDTGIAKGWVSLKAMPGHEGDIWMAGGSDGDEYGVWHSTDSGITWTKLSNVDKADTIGFGKAADGHDYMALYIAGAIGGVRGFFRSDDAGQSWIRINDDQHQFGLNSKCITGDPRIYGRVYIGTDGRGIQYGDIAGETANDSSISPTSATFDLNTSKQSDISVAIEYNGNTLEGIYNGSEALVKDKDYTVSADGTVTILKSYLANQKVGTTNLKFDFSAGNDQVLKIAVTDTTVYPDSSISPTSATFDLNTSKQSDISVAIEYNGNTLEGIYNGSEALVKDKDYTVSADGTVTILKSYLANQKVGTTNLKFDFSNGTDQILQITLTDTTVYPDSLISPTSATFDLNTSKQSDISVAIEYNGNTLEGIYNGSEALVKDKDYTVSADGTVTILKSYLANQKVGTTNLKFDFSNGTDQILTITIVNSTPAIAGSVEVQMYNPNTSVSTSGIMALFRIINKGSTAISLSDLKIRYFYTSDGSQAQNFWCDWSSVGSSNIIGKFVKMDTPVDGADTYLEISFASDAGTLAPGAEIYVQARFSKVDWSSYNQENDYSFNSTAKDYVDCTKVTAYLGDKLNWGVEP